MPRENLRIIPDLAALHQPLSSLRQPDPDDTPEPGDNPAGTEPSGSVPVNAPVGIYTGGTPIYTGDGRKPPAKVIEMYPSLAAPPREHLIPFSARIPLSMIDELSATCVQRKIDKSALVRDFIAAGLRSLKEHG